MPLGSGNSESETPRTADPVPGVERPWADQVRELAPALHAWAAIRIPRTLAGRLDPTEVTQEIWLRALEKQGEFDPTRGSFRAWLFTIAGFVLIESFRRVARVDHEHLGQSPSDFSVRQVPDDITAVSRQAARNEHLQRLIQDAQFLSPDDRRLLLFRGLEGLPYDEIASRLAIDSSTAMKRWQRLRTSLSERIRLGPLLIES